MKYLIYNQILVIEVQNITSESNILKIGKLLSSIKERSNKRYHLLIQGDEPNFTVKFSQFIRFVQLIIKEQQVFLTVNIIGNGLIKQVFNILFDHIFFFRNAKLFFLNDIEIFYALNTVSKNTEDFDAYIM